MDRLRRAFEKRFVPMLGLLAGLLSGAAAFVVAGSAIAQRVADSSAPLLEVTHVPPLLTTPGELVDLDFDAHCIDPEADATETLCEVTGSVFIRAGASGRYSVIPLANGGSSSRLKARVPEAIASSRKGFTYYAEIAEISGRFATISPAGGASAPHRSLPLQRAVEVDLGRHRFGESVPADERVADAVWGDGPTDAGLEQGPNFGPIGASAFDVDASGAVILLDQTHRRVLRWRSGVRNPTRIPLAIAGTLADMSLASDGTIYVLESVTRPGRTPLVRRFDSYGEELEATEIAERTSAQIRQGPEGPVVLQQPSEQWMPVAFRGSPIGPERQRRRGRSGRPLRGGDEVVVLRRGSEVRVALVGPSGIRRSWRVTSETPMAEVQLAEPLGQGLVLVLRVFTDSEDEFVALVLSDEGLVRRVSLDSADWAETAPLGRFRLVGNSLYQLGSTEVGAFVDRFDLEVR